MAHPDNQQSPDPGVTPRKGLKKQRTASGRFRRRPGSLFLLLIVACGVAWYFGRPYLLVYQAKSLLTTNPQKAADLLEDAIISSGGHFPDAQVLWSRALLKSGRSDEAIGSLSQIKPPEFADSDGLLKLAEEASQAHIPLLEVIALEAIRSTDVRRVEAIERLISIRQQNGDSTRTMMLAEEYARLQPGSAKPWLVMARTHEQMMALSEACADYRTALKCEQSTGEKTSSLRALVRILFHLGDRDDARVYQNKLTQLAESTTALDQINEARLLRLEGDTEKASNQVAEVLKQEPGNAEALELRATIFMEQREYSKAEADLREILRIQPWNKQAHYKLAQTLTMSGDAEAAAIHFAENRRLLALSNRIVILQRQGQLNKVEIAELINALEETGMRSIADTVRKRSL